MGEAMTKIVFVILLSVLVHGSEMDMEDSMCMDMETDMDMSMGTDTSMSMDMDMGPVMSMGMGTGLYDDLFTSTHYYDTDQNATASPCRCEANRNTLRVLAQSLIQLQHYTYNRVRSEGRSGIKQIRTDMIGPFPFHSPSHNRMSLANMHNHQLNIRTIGLGEFIAVLNGVEFRARHNDYRLQMAHSTSKTLHKTEYFPLPEVPPEVLQKQTVDEQIVEMREWFKAWAKQDKSQRDYTKYFKPVMCYLEGAWYYPDTDINQARWSDRHFMDARTWFELFKVNQFNAYAGTMKGNENIAYLPRILLDMIHNQTRPVVAQFDYRMLCHPLSRDLPLNRFRVIDELLYRVPYKKRINDLHRTHSARFKLNGMDSDNWHNGHIRYTLLDSLMREIPGLDNHPGNIEDKTYNVEKREYNDFSKILNAAYYHRWFKTKWGAKRHRGFLDDSVFMAFTTQDRVVKRKLTHCEGSGNRRNCVNYKYGVSYAFPFEIVYTTPLSSWNPYNITFKGLPSSMEGRTVTAGSRNGGLDVSKAYNGSSEAFFFRTPSEFYTGAPAGNGTYNLHHGDRGVLDSNGVLRICRGSGHKIIMDDITGLGTLRQRYPIMPVHGEGATVWKEMEAIKQILLRSKPYGYLYDGY